MTATEVLVICTRNRPTELAKALSEVAVQESPPATIIVVDSSDGTSPREVAARFSRDHPEFTIVFLTSEPGLTRQRNVGVRRALDGQEADFVFFLDDDTLLHPAYFARIREVFRDDTDPRLGGVGGIAEDGKTLPDGRAGTIWDSLKRAFLLLGPPGAILKSGRNVQMRGGIRARDVDWLQGGASCYRREVLAEVAFDEGLEGYCWGEDFDFGFRVTERGWRLVQTPSARIVNLLSPTNRAGLEEATRSRTRLLHRWVHLHRGERISVPAYWWSVAGEVLLTSALVIIGRRDRREVRGLLGGIVESVGRSP